MPYKNEAGDQREGETQGQEGNKGEQEAQKLKSRLQQQMTGPTSQIDRYTLGVSGTAGIYTGKDTHQSTKEGTPTQLHNKALRLSLGPEQISLRANLSETVIQGAISRLYTYLKRERERYWEQGRLLNAESRALFGRFFTQELLREIRVVALTGRRLTNPPFYNVAKRLGIANLPDLAHTASVTYLDVIVFNEQMTNRALFHALVHAAQVKVFGPRFFSELYVRGVMRVRSYPLSPMKAQAFGLDTRFAANPEEAFSVEGEIRKWFNEARY